MNCLSFSKMGPKTDPIEPTAKRIWPNTDTLNPELLFKGQFGEMKTPKDLSIILLFHYASLFFHSWIVFLTI